MKKLIMVPNGWKCVFRQCPPGFFVYHNALCMKSEYKSEELGDEAYCESGEAFWGGTDNKNDRDNLEVQPVAPKWVDEE